MSKTAWVVLIVVVIAAIAAFVWHGMKQSSEATSLIEEENAILVMNQEPGDSTTVSYAKLAKDGYLVVFGQNSDGSTTYLGTSDLLSAGEHKNVVVRHTSTGTAWRGIIGVTMVADDGDGEFTETDTELVINAGGAGTIAEMADGAELPTDFNDGELAGLLESAGYDAAIETEEVPTEQESTVEEETDTTTGDEEATETESDETTEGETVEGNAGAGAEVDETQPTIY